MAVKRPVPRRAAPRLRAHASRPRHGARPRVRALCRRSRGRRSTTSRRSCVARGALRRRATGRVARLAGGAAATRASAAVRAFRELHASSVDFHRWVQFELDRQLGGRRRRGARARAAASACTRISRSAARARGSDAWAFPDLFVAAASSVGAPPDPYSRRRGRTGGSRRSTRARSRAAATLLDRLLRAALPPRRRAAHRPRDGPLPPCSGSRPARAARDGAYVRFPADDLLGILALESVRARRARRRRGPRHRAARACRRGLAKWGMLSSQGAVLRARRAWRLQRAQRLSAALARDGEHARHADARRLLARPRHRLLRRSSA